MYKSIINLTLFALLLMFSVGVGQEIKNDSPKNPADTIAEKAAEANSDSHIIAYYLHGNRRCATCLKLEAYSAEALQTGFEKELADSSLIWKTVNYDENENEHFIADYQLYTKTLILSRVENGKETAWINLDKIWNLVGDKDDYIAYVQSETRKFMSGPASDE